MPTITRKGQVTVPRDIRRKLGVGPGSRISFILVRGKVEVCADQPSPAALGAQVFGMYGSGLGRLSRDRKRMLQTLVSEKHHGRMRSRR